MGLGKLITHRAPQAREPEQLRVITEFAIIDGVKVDGSGEFASRYRGGMAIPGAWRAANLLADLIGSVPWHAFRNLKGRPVELLDPAPPLLEQPSPPDTRMTTFSSLALDLLWHGNAIGIVAARSAAGWPTATIVVPADQVAVRRVTPAAFSPLPVGAIEYSIGGLVFGSSEVIHIKGPCAPGALRGIGVLEQHMETVNLSREQIRQAGAIARHGVPTGVLTTDNPDTTDDELKAAKDGWLIAQRDRTVAALRHGTRFEPLSWNPEELQLVEARKFSLTDWENIFGLPPGWLGGQQSSRVYSNVELDAINLLKFGSPAGHMARFEQTLSLQFPRGTIVKANLDALLRGDTKTRYEAHAIALSSEFLTVDEVRELEDRPPLPVDKDALDVRKLAEMVQKIYLGVDKVLTTDEARSILNQAGARLPIPAPDMQSAQPIRVQARTGRLQAIEGSVTDDDTA